MDYTARYGLEFNPFLKNSKEVFVNTQEQQETLYRLDYLAATRGFGLLTGAAGRGKTTAIRNWANTLNPSLYKVVYSSLSTLTVNDFYRNLAMELGAQPAFRKPDNFRLIQEEICRLAIEKRKTPVIIIDKANYIELQPGRHDKRGRPHLHSGKAQRCRLYPERIPAINLRGFCFFQK